MTQVPQKLAMHAVVIFLGIAAVSWFPRFKPMQALTSATQGGAKWCATDSSQQHVSELTGEGGGCGDGELGTKEDSSFPGGLA